jgi:serine/threonine protein kinase/Tol biopolymer transport system component
LNHPNIVTIYEIGSEDGINFIATEYVDGESLRLHLKISQMQLREVIDVAIQVASALATAHEAGIVHRDIKPENIMLRRDGYVKVLDFGLAKLAPDSSSSAGPENAEAPTHLMIKTEPGRVMGTVNYMSPEQARGHEVDARTDIFSLGVTIYEMLSGRRPFTGETQSDVLAAILRADPEPLAKLLPAIPAELNRIVSKTLRKDREERYQTVKELLVDLKSLRQELEFDAKMGRDTSVMSDDYRRVTLVSGTSRRTISASQSETNPPTLSGLFLNEVKSHPRRSTVTAAVIALAIIAGALGIYRLIKLAQRSDSFQTMRLAKLTSSGDVSGAAVAVSPDGKYVVYATREAGEEKLWMRHVATSSNVQILPAVDGAYTGLTFSPDGSYLYYIIAERNQPNRLYQVPVLGGTPRKLIEDALGPVTFSPDGTRLAFLRGASAPLLMLANADGTGEQTLVTLPSHESWQGGPAWSPDGQVIMAGLYSRADNKCRLVGVGVKDGKIKPLASEPWFSVFRITWLPDGSGLVVNGRDLETKLLQIWLISYPEGKTTRVTNDLSTYRGVSLTTDGKTLASIQGAMVTNLWIAPSGDANLAEKVTFESGKDVGLSGLDWTPDGKIVYTARGVGTTDLWRVERNGSNSRQLTFNAGKNFYPCVTSDARYVFFVSDRTGSNNIWRMDQDGSNPKQITNVAGTVGGPTCSSGGNAVLYLVRSEKGTTIWKTDIDGGVPTQLTTENSTKPAVSPDGKTIACILGELNPGVPAKLAIVSINGGQPVRLLDLPNVIKATLFRWSADGRAIIYSDTRNRVDNLWSQPLDSSPAKQITDFKSEQIFWFAWSPDGKVLALSRGQDNSDVALISNFR